MTTFEGSHRTAVEFTRVKNASLKVCAENCEIIVEVHSGADL